ncbi:MAG: glycosyltransferase family 4 protein [Patescibacteria group bacterium]|nr:glycosyltransferase family 4 protein [Patescibacteria group bacterium]
MKIAIFQPRVSYYIGGGEVIPLEHTHFLSLRGHSVTIVTTRAPFIKESEYFKNFCVENKDVRIAYIDVPKYLSWIYHITPGINWCRWHLESLRVGQLAFKYFLKHKFDLVVVHNVLDIISLPGEQKSIMHLHGYPSYIDPIYEACLSLPDRLVAVSKYIKNQWQSKMKLNKCNLATNGVRSDYFKPNPSLLKQYDVLYIGRLVPIKGLSYLIEAISKIYKQIPNLRVVIAGTGPEEAPLKALSRKLGLSGQIKFVGHVNSSELSDFYNSARIAVFPSYDREGILTTMLEAASCGLPIITTTACSMKEFLHHNKNGLLVQPKNSAHLARAILKLYRSEKLQRRLGMAARRSVINGWDWNKKIKSLEKIYEQASHNN